MKKSEKLEEAIKDQVEVFNEVIDKKLEEDFGNDLTTLRKENPKLILLNDLKVGETGEVIVRIVDIEQAITKTQAEYYKLKLSDNKSEININIFDSNKLFDEIKNLKNNLILIASITYASNNDTYKNYNLNSYEIKSINMNTRICNVNINEIKQELAKYIIKIKELNPELNKLINLVYKDESIHSNIFSSPLNKNGSYAFIGGFAVHTLRFCQLCESITETCNNWGYNDDNSNLKLDLAFMLTCSLLCDIGSIVKFEIDNLGLTRTTFLGELHNVSFLSTRLVLKYLDRIAISEKQKELLIHIINSSQEKLEYGAIDVPRTKESSVFTHIRRIDKEIGLFECLNRYSLTNITKFGEKTFCLDDFSYN